MSKLDDAVSAERRRCAAVVARLRAAYEARYRLEYTSYSEGAVDALDRAERMIVGDEVEDES